MVGSDEAAFLDALKVNPADDTARLVYADWLDEHDQPRKAEYLRLVSEFNCFPVVDCLSPAFSRVRELGINIPLGWQMAAGPPFNLLLKQVPDNKIAAIRVIRAKYLLSLGDSKMVAESPGATFLLNQPLPHVASEREEITTACEMPLLVQPSCHPDRWSPQLLFRPVVEPWPLGVTTQEEDIDLLIEIVTGVLGPGSADRIRNQLPGNNPVELGAPLPLGTIRQLSERLAARLSSSHRPYRHIRVQLQ
ncbi:MAG: TIGR02996 domain-containing protein [Gemmataceae bacterium]|nr:TIGR02996 domain-containing protein [Gemmataceae bacterium]